MSEQTQEPKKKDKAILNESGMQKVTETTAEKLKKQEKVKVRLYMDPDKRKQLEAAVAAKKNVKWPFTTVQINGHTYQIQYGKEVEVPESVYKVLKRSELI